MSRSGGRILVDQLVVDGTELAFGVPGESYLAVLDALHDAPRRFVAARHEAGAANMAEAYGKLTGRPGVCMVTRGPGAAHASVGVHTASQDSTPVLLLVGQVARSTIFAAYARSFGAHGATVERTEDFAAAFDEALGAGGPALLEPRVDPEAITPRQTLSEIRRAGAG